MTLLTSTLILFFILDPIGGAPVCAQAVKGYAPSEQRWILFRELLIALALMLLFSFVGEWLFWALDMNDPALWIASSLILFLVAIRILFPSLDVEFHRGLRPGEEPWITPLAVPCLAGPSLIATVMLFAHHEPSVVQMTLAIGIAWSAAAVIIMASPVICRYVSTGLLEAMEKLMGMVLILLAIQRLLQGIDLFMLAQGWK
jgi:multiple antibiotic resistance protein